MDICVEIFISISISKNDKADHCLIWWFILDMERRTIYNMCTQKPPHDHSQQLYEKYKEAFDDYIHSTVVTWVIESWVHLIYNACLRTFEGNSFTFLDRLEVVSVSVIPWYIEIYTYQNLSTIFTWLCHYALAYFDAAFFLLIEQVRKLIYVWEVRHI